MLWDEKSRINSSNIAIKDDKGRALSYGALWKQSKELKNIVPERCVVFILCDNTLETLSFYFQVICIKCVPLLLPNNINKRKLEKLIEIYEPLFIWGLTAYLDLFEESSVIYAERGHFLIKTKYQSYNLNRELALLLMTSGSTGNPKVVRISYGNLESSVNAALKTFPILETDRGITSLPMNFSYGLSFLHMHWKIGALIVATQHKMTSGEFWDCFDREKITDFQGVSETYRMLKLIGFLQRPCPSLRFITQCGNKMPRDLLDLYVKSLENVKFFVIYGQTEGTIYLTCQKCWGDADLRSVGRPLNGWKAEALDKNEEGIGEIVIYGDTVAFGYAESKGDLSLGDVNCGVLYTGDMGWIDNNGNVYLTARKSRFLKMLGMRINLDDIEEMARTFSRDSEWACTGEDDDLIIYYTDRNVDSEQLITIISESIHINDALISAEFVQYIPKTSSGKNDYRKLLNTSKQQNGGN